VTSKFMLNTNSTKTMKCNAGKAAQAWSSLDTNQLTHFKTRVKPEMSSSLSQSEAG